MDAQKGFITRFGEWWDEQRIYRNQARTAHVSSCYASWLPSRGNVIFTLTMIALLVLAQSVGALPQSRIPNTQSPSTGTIAYQGRLADASGAPLTGTYNMIFRLYTVATGGTPLWTEQWTGSNGVRVSDGLFNVMLGSLSQLPISQFTNSQSLFLGITVGTDDEMAPRVQLGSVPFAVQALTVPDGSVTTGKIADGAVTTAKVANGAVTQTKINIERGQYLAFTTDWDDRASKHLSGLKFQEGGSATYGAQLYYDGQADKLILSTLQDGVEKHGVSIDRFSGNVGIGFGTIYPAAKLSINGDILASGPKSAVVRTMRFGQRKLYATESPEVRFLDEGLARLRGGITRVKLDPVFLETIEGDYLVHVTPYGDAGLYVAEIGRDYFVVKAREGDPNVAFAWRLSATRKGYVGVRLEEVKGADHEAAK